MCMTAFERGTQGPFRLKELGRDTPLRCERHTFEALGRAYMFSMWMRLRLQPTFPLKHMPATHEAGLVQFGDRSGGLASLYA